jgi:tRNA(Arg) A34 adenosine deaminase TadA
MELVEYMRIAVDEAKASLREGNNGFGAVIIKEGKLIASAHDKEDTDGDPTSHAELNVIREASRKLGKNLSECILISTHEPCPMCASAIVWSGIETIAYGCSMKDALTQERKRLNLSSAEIFCQVKADIKIYEGVLKAECSVLYRDDVRKEIERLRDADDQALALLNEDSICRRTKWFQEHKGCFDFISQDLLDSGYRLLLERFCISPDEAPVVHKTDQEIVFHSMNFCPTLEACRILGLDTRHICKKLNENATDTLLKQIDYRLNFSRNYDKLRPYTEYCEELISISDR